MLNWWGMALPQMLSTLLLRQRTEAGAARAMSLAMEEAGVQPEEVEYINAHGTSTHHNDLFETRAIHRAFGDAAKDLVVSILPSP